MKLAQPQIPRPPSPADRIHNHPDDISLLHPADATDGNKGGMEAVLKYLSLIS